MHGIPINLVKCMSCVLAARPLNTYQPSNTKLLPYRPCAVFNHTEDYGRYILCVTEKLSTCVHNIGSPDARREDATTGA